MNRLIATAISLLLACFPLSLIVTGQPATDKDSLPKREFNRLDVFPAISYSPETHLTLGVIGITYFDLAKGDKHTSISNLEFIGVYTLNKQILLESRWELFSSQSRWRARGEAFYNRYPDRNYGLGNHAGVLVEEVHDERRDTLNYLNFDSDRIKFSPVVLRQLKKHVYLGVQVDLEYLYRLKIIPDDYKFLNQDSLLIQQMPVEGLRVGAGLQVLFDNRMPILNPLKGNMLEFNLLNYNRHLGSAYPFTSVSVDFRSYLNTLKNQTLALRVLGSAQFSDDAIPMRALSRVGGHKFIRGYFKGTYQDRQMTAFELEYRLPFWAENAESKLWQVWKRVGIVGFMGGAQVFHSLSDFQLDQFNLAAGGGLRILFNPESRTNLRIDYAIGLRRDSDGPGKRQRGLYFYLGEAF